MIYFSLQSFSIWLPLLDNSLLQCGYGFVEAMLEPHAKDNAGMTQNQVIKVYHRLSVEQTFDSVLFQVGNAFLIMGAMYMVFTPLGGMVSDTLQTLKNILDFGLSKYSSTYKAIDFNLDYMIIINQY